MARKIQSQSSHSDASAKGFLGLLANAVFWLILAVAVPAEAFLETIPELAPYAHWAPILFYFLAVLSFARAMRMLMQIVAGHAAFPRLNSSVQSARPARAKTASGKASLSVTRTPTGLPVNRTPTVQRMR